MPGRSHHVMKHAWIDGGRVDHYGTASIWAEFLRGDAQALLVVDIIDTFTVTGHRQCILAGIEYAPDGSGSGGPPHTRTPPG